MTPLDNTSREKTRLLTHFGKAIGLVWQASPSYVFIMTPIAVVIGLLPAAQLYLGKLILDMVTAILAGQVYDNALQALFLLFGAQSAISLIGSATGIVQSVLSTLTGEKLSNYIQVKILRKASEMDLASYESGSFYDDLQNAHAEAGTRPIQMLSQVTAIIQSVITMVSFTIILWTLDPWVLLVLGGTAVPGFLIQNKFGQLNYWMLRKRVPEARKQSYFSYMLRTDWLIKELKLFDLETHFIKRFNQLFKKFFAESSRLYKRRAWATFGSEVIGSAGRLSAFWFIARAVLARTLSVGDFSLFLGAVSQFRAQISAILGSFSQLYSDSLFVSNLFKFLERPSSGLEEGEVWNEHVELIEFRKVGFKYPGTEPYVLKDISFHVRLGQTLGIVGHNGAGKTTLIKLLSALYRPSEGQILFNGKDTAGYSQKSLQKQIAATFQDFGQYELTARENIELSNLDTPNRNEHFKQATRSSGVDKVLTHLPQGYDTQLGRWFEDGEQLSGGQWQKVALARSYYRDAAIVILDEPTAALDAESEFKVYENVQSQSAYKITVLISHRLASMRLADKIIVLAEGKVVEEGNHETLVQYRGSYSRQFDLQAVGYR